MFLSGYIGTYTQPCRECHNPFTPSRMGHNFCSQLCYHRKNSREYYRLHYAAKHESKKCGKCRHTYVPSRKDQRWCSLQCRENGRNRRVKFIRRTIPCKRCSTPFLKIRSDHRFCSSKCAQAWWGIRHRAGIWSSTVRPSCAQCASSMLHLTPNRKRLY